MMLVLKRHTRMSMFAWWLSIATVYSFPIHNEMIFLIGDLNVRGNHFV